MIGRFTRRQTRALLAVRRLIQPMLDLLLDFDEVPMTSSARRKSRQVASVVRVPHLRHARRELGVVTRSVLPQLLPR
jgi:hypothetical protein